MRNHTSSEHPEVTVIIPTIGRPKYILDTIRSVLAQDYTFLKILISDNAPAVSTASLLQLHGIVDERIKIATRAERLESAVHMNTCISEVDGEFLMILSDDDQLSRGYITEQVNLFGSNSNVSVAVGQQVLIAENDIGLLPGEKSAQPAIIARGLDFLEGTLSGAMRSNVATYISLFARRSDVIDVGGFKNYPDGSHADNHLFWQLAFRGHVAVGACIMFYRVYQNSTGLGTPFSALLQATCEYTRDIALTIKGLKGVNSSRKNRLIFLVRRSNFGMLRKRIRTIYIKRSSKFAIARHILESAAFALTPIRLL